MEIWDLYDENKNLTGKTMIRGEVIPDNFYHLVVHIWIKNNDGKYLISQRSKSKKSYPLKWECQGGSVLLGESSIEAAIRETKEEVGIDLNNIKGNLVYTKTRKIINNEKFNDIMDIWLFNYDGEVDLNKATTDEVCDYKWLTKEEIKKLFDSKELVQSLDYFFNEINI